MYYSEFARVKRIRGFLERLAYASVGLDTLVAVATLLVMQGGTEYSAQILMMGDYLIFLEVALAAVAVVSIFVLRHYKSVTKMFDRLAFKVRAHMIGKALRSVA